MITIVYLVHVYKRVSVGLQKITTIDRTAIHLPTYLQISSPANVIRFFLYFCEIGERSQSQHRTLLRGLNRRDLRPVPIGIFRMAHNSGGINHERSTWSPDIRQSLRSHKPWMNQQFTIIDHGEPAIKG